MLLIVIESTLFHFEHILASRLCKVNIVIIQSVKKRLLFTQDFAFPAKIPLPKAILDEFLYVTENGVNSNKKKIRKKDEKIEASYYKNRNIEQTI